MLFLARGLLVAVAVWLYTAPASALSFTMNAPPAGPVVSENGQLEFSNFQFFSPFMSVAPSQVTATILADGIQLSGPIASTGGLKNFFVLYEVRALGAGIDGASLLLDSQVDADDFGVVLSTKQILGDVHLELPDCSCDGCCGGHKGGDGFDFGLGLDHSLPTDRETLAFLKTADWDIEDPNNCFRPPFGSGDDGAIRLVEGEFDPRTSIRVIDGVSVVASDGTATWTSSINRFTTVPEPGTASLLLLALVWLARVPRPRGADRIRKAPPLLGRPRPYGCLPLAAPDRGLTQPASGDHSPLNRSASSDRQSGEPASCGRDVKRSHAEVGTVAFRRAPVLEAGGIS